MHDGASAVIGPAGDQAEVLFGFLNAPHAQPSGSDFVVHNAGCERAFGQPLLPKPHRNFVVRGGLRARRGLFRPIAAHDRLGVVAGLDERAQ